MKIAILGDLHLGARNSSSHFSEYFNSFFSDIFFPYCVANDITNVIQLGDLFDNRTSVSLKAFHACRDTWFGGMRKHGIHMYTLLGNHDIHLRESLVINSSELFLGDYRDCVTVINKPTKLSIGKYTCDVIPWVCEENIEEVSEFIERPERSADVYGHFEFGGFKMQANSPFVDEMDSTAKKFSSVYSNVISGHYHTRSKRGNVLYTGIPYQITWSDYNDPKGFHVLDTDTGEITFVENPYTMFSAITLTPDNVKMKVDPTQFMKKMVKCLYDSSAIQKRELDLVCTKIRSCLPLTLVVQDISTVALSDGVSCDTIDPSVLDTKTAIRNYVSEYLTNDKSSIQSVMTIIDELYTEALTIDRLGE